MTPQPDAAQHGTHARARMYVHVQVLDMLRMFLLAWIVGFLQDQEGFITIWKDHDDTLSALLVPGVAWLGMV